MRGIRLRGLGRVGMVGPYCVTRDDKEPEARASGKEPEARGSGGLAER